MKSAIYNIKDYTYSREMLESKPHPFIAIFVYILLALLAAALTWSYFGEIDSYVKTSGVVRPISKISTIRNSVAGRLEATSIEDGKRVLKGDVLYTIEHENLDNEKQTTTSQLNRVTLEVSNLKKLKASISDNINYFDATIDTEKDYFNKYLKFETTMKVNHEQSTNSQLDLEQLQKSSELSVQNSSNKIKEVSDEINNLKLLKKCVEQNMNLFDATKAEYIKKYSDYTYNRDKLMNEQKKRSDIYSRAQELLKIGGITQNETATAKQEFENTTLEINKYQNEFLININSSIEKNTQALDELQITLQKEQKSHSTTSGKSITTDAVVQKYKLDTLVQIDDNIMSNEQSKEKLDKELKTINLNLQNATVTAPIDGIVNLLIEVNKGDLIQSGSEVATIVPEDSSEYKIQLLVGNKDIANIKEGQNIKYHFLALPFREYGELSGSVTKIGTDARSNQQSGQSYYTVEATVENKSLKSYKGVESEIKVGMACEAQVVTKSKKILYYLLEKINLMD